MRARETSGIERDAPPPQALPSVNPPIFPERIFDIRAYGARDGGSASNTQAIQKTVEACTVQGGGTVLVPAGEWLSGSIHLGDNVRLHLEKDASLKFSTRFEDYLPVVFTRWEGIECFNFSPLVYARDRKNVAITGEGTLDGQGEIWWPWKLTQAEAVRGLYDAQANGILMEKRIYGSIQAALRPNFVQLIGCENVWIEGVTLLNGPMWTVHPVYCQNVLVRGVTIRTAGPNTDGVNPDSCRNVVIEKSLFSSGDDCIAINSGMNEDGWRVGRPCEDILIQDCRMEEGHGAVAIGSGMSGGVRNVTIRRCAVTGGLHGIRLKSLRGRGGYVENVYVEDVHMLSLRDSAIIITSHYVPTSAPSISASPPIFRDIAIRNVTCKGAVRALEIAGLPEQPVQNVSIEGYQASSDLGIECHDVDGLSLVNVHVSAAEPNLSCVNVTGLHTSDLSVTME